MLTKPKPYSGEAWDKHVTWPSRRQRYLRLPGLEVDHNLGAKDSAIVREQLVERLVGSRGRQVQHE